MFRPCRSLCLALAALCLLLASSGTHADELTGEQVYVQQCAR